ncbi:polysaccharide biosynthesis protein [Gammaproteobacteria bacterium]|nr:polysaccharide biosynthesis protein [Gammaproteobacteria bacterium]
MDLRESLISSSRLTKKLIALVCDFTSIYISILFALFVSVGYEFTQLNSLLNILWMPLVGVLVFWYLGVYRSVVRYIDFSVFFILLKAISLTLLIFLFVTYLYDYLTNKPLFYDFSYSSEIGIWLVGFMSATFFIIGSRLIANHLLAERVFEKRVVIYGAGSAGIQLAGALRVSSEMQPIAFLDKNPSLHNTFLGGIKVLAPHKLEKLAIRNKVDEVLIAMPSASKGTLRSLLKEIEKYSVKVRILPGLAELAQGKVLVSELKEVDISDLLGRFEVEANQNLINKNIKDRNVLITGAGGSIGSEIARQVVRNKAKTVIILDSNEYSLYKIRNELESLPDKVELHTVLASVTNIKRMTDVCSVFNVDTIYHSAAYKHVSIVEENPFEAITNNILGTKVCAQAAIDTNVDTFVLISTDKAVRPTNIMGATKRFAELILQSMAREENSENTTRMTMVRFGNVLGSSGSAIPLFQQQIKNGGPVTVTHPEVIRYFMSISEAAELVIQAGAMGKGGDVFVLDMGEPVKIYELAKRLINLSGMEVKDNDNLHGDIEIIFTGLRPGEKLYEELLIGDNVTTTEHKQILRAEEDSLSSEELKKYLSLLDQAERNGDVVMLRDILKETVSGFIPEEEIVDVVYKQRN